MSIKIKNLNKTYNNTPILENLNLEIKTGNIFGLLGANGVGKTTLISILNYLTTKNKGEIEIHGYDFNENKKEIKSISSYIPQNYAFYPNLTTYENLEFFGSLYGLKSNYLKSKIFYAIEATSLEKFIHKKAYTYSGGVKRRLNIAIGLLNSPKVLYLDEPTVGIDPQSRKYILDVIKNLNKEKGITTIYTSHYMEEVEYLCNNIAILDDKKIIFQDKTSTLINKENNVLIKLKTHDISVDVNHSYKKFVKIIESLNYEDIIDINFGKSNLEKTFLSITKKNLRD